MGHSSLRNGDEIDVRNAGYSCGFTGYFLRGERLAKKALDLCLSPVVASQALSGRNGVKTK